jgi:hypothetical protein
MIRAGTVSLHGCQEPLFRLAKQGLSQISSRRVLRVIGHFVLSLSRRCFGASFGDKFCRNTSDQRWPLHRPFHPLLALFLFWFRQQAKGRAVSRISPNLLNRVLPRKSSTLTRRESGRDNVQPPVARLRVTGGFRSRAKRARPSTAKRPRANWPRWLT